VKGFNFAVHVLFVKLCAVVALKAGTINTRVVNSVFLARWARRMANWVMSFIHCQTLPWL
jgi:hypothetical protein